LHLPNVAIAATYVLLLLLLPNVSTLLLLLT
jgi:hypothetical protein